MGVLAEVQIDLLPFEHARVHRVKDGKTKWERVFSTRNMGVSVLVKSQYKHLLTAFILRGRGGQEIQQRSAAFHTV